MKLRFYLPIFAFCLAPFFQHAQTPTTPVAQKTDHSYKPLMLKLNDDGSKYIRFIVWHQFWLSATENNPGTHNNQGTLIDGSDGADKAWATDFALRRSRFLAFAQISPRALILTHWGINNQSFINGGASAGSNLSSTGASNAGKRPQLYLHDAWTEYEVLKNKLYLGAGLHYWNGISRLTSQSTLNFMTMDAPIFNWATIESTDQFARQFGLYAKGQLGRLDYRFALNKPFAFGKAPADVAKNDIADFVLNEHWAGAGYVNYMFWDKENNKLPFYVGSHLGAKKVLNLGAGFYDHPGSMLKKSPDGKDSVFQAQKAFGADLFMELPLNKTKGTMFHLLATYYNYQFGTNFIRSIGILNQHPSAAATDSWAGGGNAQPTIGTGSIMYLQTGFLLPKLKNGTSFMPYATYTYKNFDRIGEASSQFALGLNYFITGHNAKLTLEYATRPVYKLDNSKIVRNGSKGQLTLQTHIFL